jgi:hypothetical protein
MKIKIIRFLWTCKSWDEDKRIYRVQTNTKHSQWFVSEYEILFQLCVVQLLALLLKMNVESL